jgi:hypothetical protein
MGLQLVKTNSPRTTWGQPPPAVQSSEARQFYRGTKLRSFAPPDSRGAVPRAVRGDLLTGENFCALIPESPVRQNVRITLIQKALLDGVAVAALSIAHRDAPSKSPRQRRSCFEPSARANLFALAT